MVAGEAEEARRLLCILRGVRWEPWHHSLLHSAECLGRRRRLPPSSAQVSSQARKSLGNEHDPMKRNSQGRDNRRICSASRRTPPRGRGGARRRRPCVCGRTGVDGEAAWLRRRRVLVMIAALPCTAFGHSRLTSRATAGRTRSSPTYLHLFGFAVGALRQDKTRHEDPPIKLRRRHRRAAVAGA